MMHVTLKQAFVGIISICILDIIWLNVAKPMYARLVIGVQKKKMQVRYLPTLIAYILMFVGLVYIVLPIAHVVVKTQTTLYTAICIGGLFGIIVYGIYNATNAAIFSDYPYWIACIDTLWGCIVYTLSTFAALHFK